MKKTFTGKNLRAKIGAKLMKRALRYLPVIEVIKGDVPAIVKIPSLYSENKIGFGCKLNEGKK